MKFIILLFSLALGCTQKPDQDIPYKEISQFMDACAEVASCYGVEYRVELNVSEHQPVICEISGLVWLNVKFQKNSKEIRDDSLREHLHMCYLIKKKGPFSKEGIKKIKAWEKCIENKKSSPTDTPFNCMRLLPEGLIN